MGASENFWADMRIFEGEKDAETLTQKMATGEYRTCVQAISLIALIYDAFFLME